MTIKLVHKADTKKPLNTKQNLRQIKMSACEQVESYGLLVNV
ncbi:hypothetical protein CVS40_1904 [Lucilia cuprina]|nr:hypothetical protein CVS40_1904 [Lucilia cuprina]